MVGGSNDETNFPHKSLLTNVQVSKLRKTFSNSSSANIELSKTQLSKTGQSEPFLGRLLRSLLNNCLFLMKNVLKPLAKRIFNNIRINSSSNSKRCSYSKESFWFGYDYSYNMK